MTTSMQRVTVETPNRKPRPYGLLNSINWLDPQNERWLFNGVQYRQRATFGTNPLALLDATNPSFTKVVQHLPVTFDTRAASACLLRVQASTGAYTPEELQAAANEAFDAQAGIFVEAAAYGTTSAPGFAVGTSVSNVTSGTPTLVGALALLESIWSTEQGDVAPTLHLPYFAYPYLEQCAGGIFQTIDGELYTIGGTRVVLGGGYTNKKIDGTAPATGTITMHMTGDVFGLRSGEIRPVEPTGNPEALDVNDLEVQVEASYVVGWNSTKTYAAYGTICS